MTWFRILAVQVCVCILANFLLFAYVIIGHFMNYSIRAASILWLLTFLLGLATLRLQYWHALKGELLVIKNGRLVEGPNWEG